ncbi:hypothetical protein AGIG_G6866 [Arapaima gigas]
MAKASYAAWFVTKDSSELREKVPMEQQQPDALHCTAKFFEHQKDETRKHDFLSQGWPEEEIHLDYWYRSEQQTAATVCNVP